MIGFGMTDRGRVRKNNQDCYAMKLSNVAISVVCDGMGGARAGDVASQLAAETFLDSLESIGDMPIDAIKKRLDEAVKETNLAVYKKALSGQEYIGMGTTLVGVVVKGNTAVIINVGDSRAYHITRGEISRITRDHSVVEDMLAKGDLTPEQAKNHPNKNLITKAIGTETEINGDIYECSLNSDGGGGAGEYILLCSDGLTNIVDDQELLAEVRDGQGLEEICRSLMNLALERGAPDNVTIVLLGSE